jgi:hypothetical protein
MKKKIVQYETGGYFGGYDSEGIPNKVQDPLRAVTFTPNEIWHREKELNEVQNVLDEMGIEYKVMILEYEIYQF